MPGSESPFGDTSSPSICCMGSRTGHSRGHASGQKVATTLGRWCYTYFKFYFWLSRISGWRVYWSSADVFLSVLPPQNKQHPFDGCSDSQAVGLGHGLERRPVDFVSVSTGTRLTFEGGFKDFRRAMREDLVRDACVKRMLFSYRSVRWTVIQQGLVLWLCIAKLQDYRLKHHCLTDHPD